MAPGVPTGASGRNGALWLSAPEAASLSPGELIGSGVSSFVSRVLDRPELVLKTSRAGHRSDLAREALFLFMCRGLGVPELWGAAQVGEEVRLVLGFVPGVPVDEAMARLEEHEAARLAYRVLSDVGSVLAALHRFGAVHGDVKPANLRVDESGAVHLLDLGLASWAGDASPGGTPAYFEPGALARTPERDVFALALSVAEIADPSLRGDPDPARGTRARLPPGLAALVGPLLDPRPRARPGLGWLADELAHARVPEGTPGGLPSSRPTIEARLRAEYLRVRFDEVLLAHGRGASVAVGGKAGEWLGELLELVRELGPWLGRWLDAPNRAAGRTPLGPLDVADRARLVSRVTGAKVLPGAIPNVSDDELLARLGHALERGRWGGLSRGALLDETEAAPGELRADATFDLGLDLGRIDPSPRALRAAEEAKDLSLPLALRAAVVLRRRGHLSRALALLEARKEPEARLERARSLRLLGEVEAARSLVRELASDAALSSEVRSHGAALLARLEHDSGAPETGLLLLRSVSATPPSDESQALCLLSLGRREEALEVGVRALSGVLDDEQEARLLGVVGLVHHQLGSARLALDAFRRASELAERASALAEEGTYLTGLAAAASDAGLLDDALRAARRAELVFESLGQPERAARAVLNQVAVFASVGASDEVLRLGMRGMRLARAGGDRRCQGYLALCQADAESGARKTELVHLASQCFEGTGELDRLRVLARLHRIAEVTETPDAHVAEGDELARTSDDIEARIEWWTARAEVLVRGAPEERSTRLVLREVEQLVTTSSESLSEGPLTAHAERLAERVGDAKLASVFARRRSRLRDRLASELSPELHVHAERLFWVHRTGVEVAEFEPIQLAEVEKLLRALSGGDGLRPLLRQTLDLLLLWTGAPRGMILLPAPGDRLVVRAARNLDRRDLGKVEIELSRSMARRALEEGRPVVAVDAVRDGAEASLSVHALSLRSVLAVPLLAHGRALGVAYLDDRVRPGAFGEKELGWVRLIGTIAALALSEERDRLALRRVARRARRAEELAARELDRTRVELELAEKQLSRRSRADLLGEFGRIVGRSTKMVQLLETVERVARSEVPVLILGESGTGKELIARAVVENGPRRSRPFVVENCAAVPEGLLESTLFGHKRGAFTGAHQDRVGLFELASGGTLFLDEIGEMSLSMQAKLLRVLSDGEVRPVGAERSRKVNVRVMAATHRNLDELVRTGRFREDLFYRLGVVKLEVPALRERPEDVDLLVDHFIALHDPRGQRTVSPAARQRLREHPWPGNVRQLENEVRRALVLGGQHITVTDLNLPGASSEGEQQRSLREHVDALERRLIEEALEAAAGNRTQAAKALGVSRFGLAKMVERLGIDQEAAR